MLLFRLAPLCCGGCCCCVGPGVYIPCPELLVEGLEAREELPVCGLETDPFEGALVGPCVAEATEYEEGIEGAILGSGDMCVVGSTRGV